MYILSEIKKMILMMKFKWKIRGILLFSFHEKLSIINIKLDFLLNDTRCDIITRIRRMKFTSEIQSC